MRHSIWLSREEVYHLLANPFFNAGHHSPVVVHQASESKTTHPTFRYLPGGWLNELLYRLFFRLKDIQWNFAERHNGKRPGKYGRNLKLLASANQFIISSIDESDAFPLLLYIEGYSYSKIARVLEISPAQALLRIQKGKNKLHKQGRAWEKIWAN